MSNHIPTIDIENYNDMNIENIEKTLNILQFAYDKAFEMYNKTTNIQWMHTLHDIKKYVNMYTLIKRKKES
jgi:hypothetical protein